MEVFGNKVLGQKGVVIIFDWFNISAFTCSLGVLKFEDPKGININYNELTVLHSVKKKITVLQKFSFNATPFVFAGD